MPASTALQIQTGRHRGAQNHFPRVASRGRSGWTIAKLALLRELNHAFRSDLVEIADLLGETRHHCNLALDAMLGRSAIEAYAYLEQRASMNAHHEARV